MFMEHSAAVAARSVVREAWRAGRVVVEVAVFTGCVMHVCVRTGLSSRALLFGPYHCSRVYIFCRRQSSEIRGCIRTPAILSFKSGQDDFACLIFAFSLPMAALLRGIHDCNAKAKKGLGGNSLATSFFLFNYL